MLRRFRTCLAAALVTASARAQTPPAGDGFYVPPSPLPDGKPGDVIWSRESVFSTDATTHAPATDVRAYQVLYRSTSALGKPNAVTGTVLVPRSATGDAIPVVGYAVGTQGMGDSCAASKGLADGSTYEAGFVRSALDRGWAVAVSDYEGLGTPGDHTYVVNLSLGHAVLDSVRAAMRLPEAKLSASAPVLLWGYSEGGGAAAAAAELAPTYAPELSVRALASGAAPADLVAAGKYQDGQIGFGSVFIAGLGYDAAYPELHLGDNLNALGKTEADYARGACILDIVSHFANHRMSEYTLADPLDNRAFVARLEENHLGRRNPRVPVYLYHGEVDQVIPLAVGEALRDDYCARGASVAWTTYPGAEHIGGQAQGFAAATAWLADRLNGVPAESVCPPLPDAGVDGGAQSETPHAASGHASSGCTLSPRSARNGRNGAIVWLTIAALLLARRRRTSGRLVALSAAMLAACSSNDGASTGPGASGSGGHGAEASGGDRGVSISGNSSSSTGGSSTGGSSTGGNSSSGGNSGSSGTISSGGGSSSVSGGASSSSTGARDGGSRDGSAADHDGGAPPPRMSVGVNVHDYPKPTAYGFTTADGKDRMGDALEGLGVTAVRGATLGDTSFLARLRSFGVKEVILGLTANAHGKPFDPSTVGPALDKSLVAAAPLGLTVQVEGLNEWDLFHSRTYNDGVIPAGMSDRDFVAFTQKALYAAAHARGLKVLGPSIGHSTDPASVAYFPDVSASVDIVNAHLYFTQKPESLDLAALIAVHASYQGTKKPVWVTETGISAYGGVSADAQADVIRRGLATYAASGLIERLYDYELLDDHLVGWDGTALNADTAEYHFGLYTYAGDPKPAATPFRDYLRSP